MKILWTKRLFSLFIFLNCYIFFGTNYFCEEKASKKGESMEDVLLEVRKKASEILDDVNPDQLEIIPYRDAWLKGRPVFCCMDACRYTVVFAKDEEVGWIRVSGVGDFTGMNMVLKDYIYPKSSLNDTKALVEFTKTFYELYRNPFGEVLSKEFIEENEKYDFVGWLRLDHNVEHLKSLCSDPIATTEGEIITIKFNVLKMGGVDCWTLYGKHINDHISIEQVTTSVLVPSGTYRHANLR